MLHTLVDAVFTEDKQAVVRVWVFRVARELVPELGVPVGVHDPHDAPRGVLVVDLVPTVEARRDCHRASVDTNGDFLDLALHFAESHLLGVTENAVPRVVVSALVATGVRPRRHLSPCHQVGKNRVVVVVDVAVVGCVQQSLDLVCTAVVLQAAPVRRPEGLHRDDFWGVGSRCHWKMGCVGEG